MRKIKYSCLVALMLVACIVLASCGVTLNTTMTVDTANGGFAGTRTMVVTLDSDDIEKIEGGAAAIDNIARTNLPADLTYSIVSPDASNSTLTFTLSFATIDEYRTKVTNLLNLIPDNDLTPVIHYEKQQSIFKEGIKFEENFTSENLLEWFKAAVRTANIVSESESNWVESTSSSLVIDGTEMSTRAQFSVDEQISKCFDRCEVYTTLNTDGSVKRTITFKAGDDTIETLRTDNKDFDGYMKGVVKSQKGITVTINEPNEDSSYTEYVYSFTAKDSKECAKLTNAVMQNNNNSLSFEISAKKGADGMAVVKINEAVDASFYTDDDSYVRSTFNVAAFPQLNITEENVDVSRGDNENERYYRPEAGGTATITGEFKVGFEKVDLKLDGDSKNLDIELNFTVSSTFTKDIRKIVLSNLEKACKGTDCKYSAKDNVATVSIKGTPDEVKAAFNKMVKVYQDGGEGFCEAELKELTTASKFTTGTYGSLSLNLAPVIGADMPIYINETDATDIVSGIQYDEEGNAFTESRVNVNFTIVKVDILVVILTIVFGIIILAAAGLIFIKRKDIGEMITSFKTMLANRPKKVKPAPGAVPPYGAVPPQYGAPMQAPGAVPPQYGAPMQAPGAVPPQYGAPTQAPGAVPPQYGAPMQAPGAVPPQYGAPVQQPVAPAPASQAPVGAPENNEGEVR